MIRTVYFKGNIVLKNNGFHNVVIDRNIADVLDEFTDTFENAIQYVITTYSTSPI